MAYHLEIERQALREIARLPWRDQERIEAAIDGLADDPRPRGCQPVKATDPGTYRLRVGDYRVVYVVLDAELLIIVARVARRREDTYKGL